MEIHNSIDHEGSTREKYSWFFELLSGKLKGKVSYILDDFAQLDVATIQQYFGDQVTGILIDIDDCIAPAYAAILPKNSEKIQEIMDLGIKVGFISNGLNGVERTRQLVEKGAIYCNTREPKPAKTAFLEACDMIGTDPLATITIGDDISKDGGSLQRDKNGNTLLGGFILVKPIGNSYRNIPPKKWINYTGKKFSRWITNYLNI